MQVVSDQDGGAYCLYDVAQEVDDPFQGQESTIRCVGRASDPGHGPFRKHESKALIERFHRILDRVQAQPGSQCVGDHAKGGRNRQPRPAAEQGDAIADGCGGDLIQQSTLTHTGLADQQQAVGRTSTTGGDRGMQTVELKLPPHDRRPNDSRWPGHPTSVLSRRLLRSQAEPPTVETINARRVELLLVIQPPPRTRTGCW